ncbi:hypothetical protein MKW92_020546 [Papaver armeniacum]|nr:hypothetical protein MKW92_020546 [Papaver armeniacum]
MAINCSRSLRSLILAKEAVGVVGRRTFAAGAKAKKGGKGSGAVVGGNILKEGTDPKLLADSEYPDWLGHLLDKKPALSELRRKNIETLPYDDLKRLVKLDNRARIKENNSVKAKH